MVDSLQYLEADTLDCKAHLYWRIIAQGKKVIPFLIDKLTDTTKTNVRWHCKKSRLNVGEIAQFALEEIASFPAFLVTNIQYDLIYADETGKGCWNFYDFFIINANKSRYQKNMSEWYKKEKLKYKAEKIPKARQTPCQKKYGIHIYYNWIE